MKKSEKNALTDAIAMLNAIVNGSDEDGKDNHLSTSSEEEKPSDKEIDFIRKIANVEPFGILGYSVRQEEGIIGNIQIGKTCLRRMVTAYLEKYCHE